MSSVNIVINASNLKIGYSEKEVLALINELEIQQ